MPMPDIDLQPADRRTLIVDRNAHGWELRRGVELPLVEDDEWVAPRGPTRDVRSVYNRRAEGGGRGVCARGEREGTSEL